MSGKLSVVVATYNRLPLLKELLRDLSRQSHEDFEVVVVDDGSLLPVEPALNDDYGFPLRVLTQKNGGAARARHAGILAAAGEVVVIVDDDMRVGDDFLLHHQRAHQRGATLVQGMIAPPADITSMPLFERFHAYQLLGFVERVRRGKRRVRGVDICTGNLSLRREAYLRLGGFDRSLLRSEDRELGVRFEKAGERLELCTEAVSRHGSDHQELDFFLRRAFDYGTFDLRIATKHPDVHMADPWRFWFEVSPLSRPLLLLTVALPGPAATLAAAAVRAALAADRVGLERLAIAGATLAYGVQYFRGLRQESGSLAAALSGLSHYLEKRSLRLRKCAATLVRAVSEDFRALARHRAKYNHDYLPFHHLPIEVVRKIGLQMMVAIRVMHFWRDAGVPLAAQMSARLIRHFYGADVHWDATLAPGTTLIHGAGLVVSRAARVDTGCILFHNVTLGEGIDGETRRIGAPHLEKNVHIGPGATLLGPITVGEGSKVMAGAVLARSVPPGSLVRPAEPLVTLRQVPPDAARVLRPLAENDDQERIS